MNLEDVYLDLLPLLEKVAQDGRSNHGDRLRGDQAWMRREWGRHSPCAWRYQCLGRLPSPQPLNACDGAGAHPRPWIHECPDRPSRGPAATHGCFGRHPRAASTPASGLREAIVGHHRTASTPVITTPVHCLHAGR